MSRPLHPQLFVFGCVVVTLALLTVFPGVAVARSRSIQDSNGGCGMTLLLAVAIPVALLGLLLVMSSYSSAFGR